MLYYLYALTGMHRDAVEEQGFDPSLNLALRLLLSQFLC